MASIIGVETLQHTNGTTAATIDSSGNLLPSSTGSVLQVVTKLDTDYTEVETTSTSFVSTGLSISITPRKSNSKLLVRFDFNGDNGGSNSSVIWTIYRGSTNICPSDVVGLNRLHDTGSRTLQNESVVMVDEPNTTNEVTYTLYQRVNTVGPVRVRNNLTQMVMTVMEIAG